MEGVDEVRMLILSSENILLVSAGELDLVILVQEVDLVRVARVWIREEEIVRGQTDRIQSEVRPLATDPLDQFSSWKKE